MLLNPKQSKQKGLDCVVEIAYKPLGEKGEDAFAYSFEEKSVHTQAVFDGCGGSGSWQYAEYNNATGAFISAQSMAKAYLEWFNAVSGDIVNDSKQAAASFQKMAQDVLVNLKSKCAAMKVSGSLVKAFPCTASVALMSIAEDTLSLTTLNIGDSRIYCMGPLGLIQLTVDDSEGNPDPLESLRESAPLSDMLNADKAFSIKARHFSLGYPCAIICASDGIFGFLRSPMDFEYLLLKTLMDSNSVAQYENKLQEKIVEVTGDDSTCIMSFYGWGSFENIKKQMSSRYQYISSVVQALNEAMETGTFNSVLEEKWATYKKQTLINEMQG